MVPPDSPKHSLCRSVRQRLSRRARVVCEVNHTVDSLNQMFGNSTAPDLHASGPQQEVLSHLYSVHASCRLSEAGAGTPEEARRTLLGAAHAYQGDAPTTVRSYDRSLLSIPSVGKNPVSLAEILPDEARSFLIDVDRMLCDPQEWGRKCEEMQHISSYMDPRLRFDRSAYHQFIRDLHDGGLVSE